MKTLSLTLILLSLGTSAIAQTASVEGTPERGTKYVVKSVLCANGTLNETLASPIGTTAIGAFLMDAKSRGGRFFVFGNVLLETFPVSGTKDSVCNNNEQETELITIFTKAEKEKTKQ